MSEGRFVTVVVVLRNPAPTVVSALARVAQTLDEVAADHELLLIDNASPEAALAELEQALVAAGLRNVLLLKLAHPLSAADAERVGLENALGDAVLTLDLSRDPIEQIGPMLERFADGDDVVSAAPVEAPREGAVARVLRRTFHALYARIHGVDLSRETAPFKLLSRRVVTHVLNDPVSASAWTHLPAAAGFRASQLRYPGAPAARDPRSLLERAEHALRLLVASGPKPMRLVSLLCLFGALANVLYSGYVVLIFLLKDDVAPGWVTLSLQQSGMFLLISLVLLMLAEYVLIATRGATVARLNYALKGEWNSPIGRGRARP
jgi:polyisoprenyl-phosphate glycosyltransferase